MPVDRIALQIHSLYVESWGHRVALLHAAGSPERVLPIWVDPPAADAILMALHGERLARPSTHDLLLGLIGLLDAPLQYVLLKRIANEVYCAELGLARDGDELCIEARSGDAIGLALRAGVPILIERNAYEGDSLPYTEFTGLGSMSSTQIAQVKRHSIANVSTLSLVDVAELGVGSAAEWQGEQMVAVALPPATRAIGYWGQLPDEDEPMWLLLSPERWARITRQAGVRKTMLGDETSSQEGEQA